MTFKATSPDGARTVTFSGTVTGNEIDFTRDVEVVAGGDPGGQACSALLARADSAQVG